MQRWPQPMIKRANDESILPKRIPIDSPPFTEKVATYKVKLLGTTVYINPKAFEEGTEVEPCFIT